jgi:hypothetical protein
MANNNTAYARGRRDALVEALEACARAASELQLRMPARERDEMISGVIVVATALEALYFRRTNGGTE